MLRMLSVPNKNSKKLAVVLSCRHKPWKLIIWCCWLANEPRIRTHEHSHCYAHCLVTFSLPSWFAQGSYCIDVCSGFTKRPLHSKLKFVNSCWQTWDKIWRRQWVLVFLVLMSYVTYRHRFSNLHILHFRRCFIPCLGSNLITASSCMNEKC